MYFKQDCLLRIIAKRWHVFLLVLKGRQHMSNTQYYWSEQARLEFVALFDDGHHSASFKESVSGSIARGWQGNRDKPFWAMALVVATLAEDSGGGDGLDLITLVPAQLQARLKSLPEEKRLKFSPVRIAVLRKITEFFLAADSFANADKIMKIFASLAEAGSADAKTVKAAGQELAQIAYRYRKEHFLDAHAASAFSIVKKFLAIRKDFRIDDEAIFAFWTWPESQSFQTYRKAFAACHDFYIGLQEAGIIDAMTKAASVDEPAIANCLAAVDSDFGYIQEEDDVSGKMIALLEKSDLKPFTKKELDFLSLTLECGEFGQYRSIASLRLLSFHPVQSAISNSLRTGQSAIPLEERVQCPEAAHYRDIMERLGKLDEKIRGILKISLALRKSTQKSGQKSGQPARTGAQESEREKELVAQGVFLLKKKRSKRWDRPQEELQEAFALLEETLVVLLGQLEGHVRGMTSSLKDESHGTALFMSDQKKFATEFTGLYL